MINFDGLLIGIVTFLIIGLFHPVVEGRVLLGDEMLVDIPCLGDFRSDSLPVYRQRVCVPLFAAYSPSHRSGRSRRFSSRRERVQKGWFLEIKRKIPFGTIVR